MERIAYSVIIPFQANGSAASLSQSFQVKLLAMIANCTEFFLSILRRHSLFFLLAPAGHATSIYKHYSDIYITAQSFLFFPKFPKLSGMLFDTPFDADSDGFESLNDLGKIIFINVMSNRLRRCSPPALFERVDTSRDELIIEIRSFVDILVCIFDIRFSPLAYLWSGLSRCRPSLLKNTSSFVRNCVPFLLLLPGVRDISIYCLLTTEIPSCSFPTRAVPLFSKSKQLVASLSF